MASLAALEEQRNASSPDSGGAEAGVGVGVLAGSKVEAHWILESRRAALILMAALGGTPRSATRMATRNRCNCPLQAANCITTNKLQVVAERRVKLSAN